MIEMPGMSNRYKTSMQKPGQNDQDSAHIALLPFGKPVMHSALKLQG